MKTRAHNLLICLGTFFVLGLSGCAPTSNLMPLNPGSEWTYSVTSGFQTYLSKVKVGEKSVMGSKVGVQVVSPLGINEFAWDGKTLVVGRFANARFVPPVPLVVDGFEPKKPKDKKKSDSELDPNQIAKRWRGEMRSFGQTRTCTAQLFQRPEKIENSGQSVRTIRTILRIYTGKSVIETKTWFQSGKGIVQQEQRTQKDSNSVGSLSTSIELIGYRSK